MRYYCWSLLISTFTDIAHYDYFPLLSIVTRFEHHYCVLPLLVSCVITMRDHEFFIVVVAAVVLRYC